jgi:hypothetical protein
MTVGFVTAAGLVNQLAEARDEKRAVLELCRYRR